MLKVATWVVLVAAPRTPRVLGTNDQWSIREIPVRQIMPRQEDMNQKVLCSNPRAIKRFLSWNLNWKRVFIIMLWNLYPADERIHNLITGPSVFEADVPLFQVITFKNITTAVSDGVRISSGRWEKNHSYQLFVLCWGSRGKLACYRSVALKFYSLGSFATQAEAWMPRLKASMQFLQDTIRVIFVF